jgi:hypothetical protein
MSARHRDLIPENKILRIIVVVRGEKVILDSDLVKLYCLETRHLNEQVRRNIEKFPDDFMFQSTKEEFEDLKSHFATSTLGGRAAVTWEYGPGCFQKQVSILGL